MNGPDQIALNVLVLKISLGLVMSSIRMIFTLGLSVLTKDSVIVNLVSVLVSVDMKELPAKEPSVQIIATTMELAGLRNISPLKLEGLILFLGTQ